MPVQAATLLVELGASNSRVNEAGFAWHSEIDAHVHGHEEGWHRRSDYFGESDGYYSSEFLLPYWPQAW